MAYGTVAYGTQQVFPSVDSDCLKVSYLIERTFDLLLGGAREERNQLAVDVDASSTTIEVSHDLGSLQRGTYLAIDDETMYVWGTTGSSGSSTVTVQRGDKGSTASPHNAQSIIQVNPYFTRYDVKKTLQDEIRSWGPQVFQVKATDINSANFIRGYDLGILGSWFNVLNVSESPETLYGGPQDNLWRGFSYRVDRNVDPNTFPSGSALFVTEPLGVFDTPKTLRITYSAAIDVDTSFQDDDCLHHMGIDNSEVDIPPYGAAWRLAAGREVRRMLTEAQGQNNDLQNFPPGYQLKAAEGFQQLRDSRLSDAEERLRAQFPIRRTS